MVAAMLSLGILALTTYWKSFDKMREAGLSPQRIYQEICADELTFIAAAMGVTALFTALLWQSLFPSLRDCLALAGLPISGRQIFAAKFGALLLALSVFVLAPENNRFDIELALRIVVTSLVLFAVMV